MYQSLEKHSLKRASLHNSIYAKKLVNRTNLPETMLWDLANDHDICYGTDRYLFQANRSKGKMVALIVNELINGNIAYLAYMNIPHNMQSSRMYLDLWTFKNKDEAKKWLAEMKDSLTGLNRAHLIRLDTQFTKNKSFNLNQFVDPYYEDDIGKQKLQSYELQKRYRPHVRFAKTFSPESIVRISNRNKVNRATVYISMIEYNECVKAYNKRAKKYVHSSNLHQIDLLNEKADKLENEYHSYCHYDNSELND